MGLDFKINDIIHRIHVKFVKAFLPDAKKPYYLKAVRQSELDIHSIASKAQVYNMTTSPKVIEEGLSAGIELIYYLVADGYTIKTPLVNIKLRFPGEYKGSETALAEGKYPEATIRSSREFRNYIRDKVEVEFGGIDNDEGIISDALDEASGSSGEIVTKGNLLTISGRGIKIEPDPAHEKETGVFFYPEDGEAPIKAAIVPVNTPKTVKLIVPNDLKAGTRYKIGVLTMGSLSGRGNILKNVRSVKSDFSLIA